MKPVIYEEARKIWTRMSRDMAFDELKFELEIHKKLLSFFQIGDYYYYVINIQNGEFDLISSEVKAVLGYNVEDVDVSLILDNIHPEDKPYFLSFEIKVSDFFSKLTLNQIPNYKLMLRKI